MEEFNETLDVPNATAVNFRNDYGSEVGYFKNLNTLRYNILGKVFQQEGESCNDIKQTSEVLLCIRLSDEINKIVKN
ncbi:hypothetical protein [Flavobacterium tructae]|uniref:Uncharacterized protein n=1 Tax=Flavobacterium tructae TaxID=1114873 RepID=A0A1S1J7H4_9FLAO|nr:hypothetical protein [Flavobacterium tructae]OHT46602.1 hypothetical protein BHE19_03600 [Flavobacterium tructae]OXB20914.1 hypothetical protein B0A71_04780 [Flavobacterium tructae]OXB25437.1 hypothetical protein B0A80_00750 [Flavobacterium tructae]